MCIRKLLSKESHPPVEKILETGILDRMIQLLSAEDSRVQFEAAWAITNIASTDYTRTVVEAGAIGPLVNCMMVESGNVREQAIWCCGNIAGDCPKYRDLIINTNGALDALLTNLQEPETPSLLRNATWTLSNICRGKPAPSIEVVQYVLPALAALISNNDREVIQDAVWGLSYLTDGDEHMVQAVVDSGITNRCVELMGFDDVTIVMPALRTVGNLISGKDTFTQLAIEAGALNHLVPLLAHPKRNIRREACWAVSNVAAGTPVQVATLMSNTNLMSNVIFQLRNGEWNVRKEATWVISNIAVSGPSAYTHIQKLVELGVIEPLTEMLKSPDIRLLCTVLETIGAVLHVGNGFAPRGSPNSVVDVFEESGLLDSLESLQQSDNDDIYNKCVDIIEKYYGKENNEDEDFHPPPQQYGNGNGPFGIMSENVSSGNMNWSTGFLTPPNNNSTNANAPACQSSQAPPAPSMFSFGMNFA